MGGTDGCQAKSYQDRTSYVIEYFEAIDGLENKLDAKYPTSQFRDSLVVGVALQIDTVSLCHTSAPRIPYGTLTP